MAEMNFIARFFVNRSAARRAARRLDWIRRSAAVPARAETLEIGCGNAQLAVRFVDGFAPVRYVATDVDPRQLDEARKALSRRYPNGVPPSLELREADMLRLPFPDGSFDVVLAFLAIHHAGKDHHDATQVPHALAEIDRVLRPGGVLLYAEFLHKGPIRRWLTEHGFTLSGVQRRWRLESVVARKAAPGPRYG